MSASGKHLYVIYLLDEGRKAWIRWLEFKCSERSLLWYFTFIVEGSYLVSFFNLYCPRVVEDSTVYIFFLFLNQM